MEELTGKKVLLLAPSFFGYEIEIKKELQNLGAKVYHYDERPKNDFFTKVFLRLNFKNIIQKKINTYYHDITEQTKDLEIDFLLLVSPEAIDNKKIDNIKKHHQNIKVYTYMWDSIKNKKKSLTLLEKSDKFFTFDLEDKKNNQKIDFHPLFYINDYKNMNIQSDYKYDFTFIGTIHSDRYKIVKKIEKFSKENDLKIFFYFYSPSRILFFFQKLFRKDFKYIDKNDISYNSMNKDEIVNIIKNSKVVIDIHHPLQTGLTIRTLEILGAKRKLLTTNENIKNYDFFHKNNIALFDRNEINIDINFIKSELYEVDDKIYEKYSINGWLKKIFKGETK